MWLEAFCLELACKARLSCSQEMYSMTSVDGSSDLTVSVPLNTLSTISFPQPRMLSSFSHPKSLQIDLRPAKLPSVLGTDGATSFTVIETELKKVLDNVESGNALTSFQILSNVTKAVIENCEQLGT